jgi:acyl-CoA reductase-like NAD-dependent aldehyde dehydrogenase
MDERRAVLVAIADAIQNNVGELARLLTQEQGKPLGDATGEILGASAFYRYFAILDLPARVVTDDANGRIEVRRKPLGVVGCIIPWNFPMILMAFKVPAALLAGNTVIVKPAPTTPLTALKLGELIKDLVPPGVVNIIADASRRPQDQLHRLHRNRQEGDGERRGRVEAHLSGAGRQRRPDRA